MAEPKIYVPRSSAKEIQFQGGGSMLKLSFKVDEFIAFLQQHKNAKGYINLVCSKRREVGQYGDSHSLTLDTWKPNPQGNPGEHRPRPRPTQAAPSTPVCEPAPEPEESDIPF